MPGILDLFVPRERKFFDMLKDLSEKTHSGAKAFLRFISEYDTLSAAKRQAIVDELKGIERDCDEVTHSIAIELNKTFLTPIDREDIHKLSTLTDDVMDMFYSVSYKLILYNIRKKPRFVPELSKLAYDCTEEIDSMISKLGKGEKAEHHIKRLHELEEEADSIKNKALAYLFNDSLGGTEIIKLKDIYEWLEGITDKCEDVADVIEGIIIKYA
ncbi:DUF47 family protein [Candidatus Woesearchaeota archaeon]|nr:DUF47 family protein [Candidatus Woesearchaeota archaeon]